MSFVLAMVLSVGLGLSSLYAVPENTSSRTNSGIATSSGTASGLNPAASKLADRISQVFHYESGILVSATGADGSVTIYDQGKYRGTMAMGLDGSYTWSHLAFYGSDYGTIMKAGGMDNFLLSIGVKPEQLKGGGEEEVNFYVVDPTAEMEEHLNDEGYSVTDADKGKYYQYKTKVNDEEVTKILTEEEYNNLSDEEKRNCTEAKAGSVKKVHKDKTEPQRLGWLDNSLDHLSKGQNYSMSIDFTASQGASVTLNIDGKAMQTFAWDGALTSQNEYSQYGVTTYTLEKGSKLAESLQAGKNVTEDKWVATVTIGGKVMGVYDAQMTGSGFTVIGGVSSKQYTYNADGTIQSVFDATTSNTTHYVANQVKSVTGPLKDANGNTIYEQYKDKSGKTITYDEYKKLTTDQQKAYEGSTPVMATVALYEYYDNGLINTVQSSGADGAIETTAFINNKALTSYAGTAAAADAIRANVLYNMSLVANGENPDSIVVDSRIKTINWQPEQLAKIYNNGNWDATRLAAFVKVCGWDNTERTTAEAMDLIKNSLTNTNWLSQAMTVTYSATAYSQSEIDSIGQTSTKIPANKFVSSVTTFNRGAAYATYNFANLDPSVSRAFYLFVNDTFNTGSNEWKNFIKDLQKDFPDVNFNFSETMSSSEYRAAFKAILTGMTNIIEAGEVRTKNMGSRDSTAEEMAEFKDVKNAHNFKTSTTRYYNTGIEKVKKLFKNNKFGEFFVDLNTVSFNSGTSKSNNIEAQQGEANTEAKKLGSAAISQLEKFFNDIIGGIESGSYKELQSAMNQSIKGFTNSIDAYSNNDPAVEGTLFPNVSDDELIAAGIDPTDAAAVAEYKENKVLEMAQKLGIDVNNAEAMADLRKGFYTDKATGKTYAIVSAKEVNIMDGTGFQAANGETIFVEVTGKMKDDIIAKGETHVMFMGDVTNAVTDADGNSYMTMVVNENYSGGVALGSDIAQVKYDIQNENLAWVRQNTAVNRAIFGNEDGVTVNWKDGWNDLVEFQSKPFVEKAEVLFDATKNFLKNELARLF